MKFVWISYVCVGWAMCTHSNVVWMSYEFRMNFICAHKSSSVDTTISYEFRMNFVCMRRSCREDTPSSYEFRMNFVWISYACVGQIPNHRFCKTVIAQWDKSVNWHHFTHSQINNLLPLRWNVQLLVATQVDHHLQIGMIIDMTHAHSIQICKARYTHHKQNSHTKLHTHQMHLTLKLQIQLPHGVVHHHTGLRRLPASPQMLWH